MPGFRSLRILGLLCIFALVVIVLSPPITDRWQEVQRVAERTRQKEILEAARDQERQEHRDAAFVVGFHIGPSYTASVALFRNGTTLNFVRIDGSAEYRAAMQRRLARAEQVVASRDDNDPEADLGSATPHELETVFIPAIAALKKRSEAILQQPITHVNYATPWVDEYANIFRDYEHDAFVLANQRLGIKPPFVFDHYYKKVMLPRHVNEANAALAGNGQQLCPECFCIKQPEEPWGFNSDFYYINLSSTSLFISKQDGTCAYSALDAHFVLHSGYGLEKLRTQDSIEYWAAVRALVLAEMPSHHEPGRPAATILIAGEAVTNPDYTSLARSIQISLGRMRNRLNTLHGDSEHQRNNDRNRIQLIVAEDGIFDAAKGAALMMRPDFWDYCKGEQDDAMAATCFQQIERNGVAPNPWFSTR